MVTTLQTREFFDVLGGSESVAEPTPTNLLDSVIDAFTLFGGTQKEELAPQTAVNRPIITADNYAELARAEIARQTELFGDRIGVKKQAAILTAFQQLAGKRAGVPQETLDFLERNVQSTSFAGQSQEILQRANNFAATTVERVGNVFDFLTSPIGVVLGIGAVAVVVVFTIR